MDQIRRYRNYRDINNHTSFSLIYVMSFYEYQAAVHTLPEQTTFFGADLYDVLEVVEV